MSETETRAPYHSLRTWIVNHDDSWLFIALYIGLAVVLSIWISLFWLVVVVGVHFLFEWVRQSHVHRGFSRILAEVLWELKLDGALILFALALALYMDIVLGVVGLQSAARVGAAARAGVRSGARFAAWERTLRGILLSVDDAAQVARAVATGRGRAEDDGIVEAAGDEQLERPSSDASPWGRRRDSWGKGDWIAIGLGLFCILLILFSPWLTAHTAASALATLATELRPFPSSE